MSLIACGINHKTAPLALREKIVFAPEQMPQPLLALLEQPGVQEAAILSTCNRTELYCASNDPAVVVDWLHRHQQLPEKLLNPCLYIHHDQLAVQHMLRVASGLDSMVLGESQILGQLKTAYLQATSAGTLGKRLTHLFQYVFSVSKQVRTETSIGVHPISIATTAIDLTKHIFADFTQVKVLCIGVGQTMELVTQYLQKIGVTQFWLANRTLTRAQKFAQKLNGQALTLDEIADILPTVDLVVSATASPLPIIGKGAVERALKKRKRRLMCMLDLAVPRDIEPEISTLSDVYLYSLDDLQNVIQQNLTERQAAAQQAETIIAAQSQHYMRSLGILEAVPLIRNYREKAALLRDKELLAALDLLQTGTLSPEQVLERLAHRLTNKLLHGPTQQLRKAAYANEDELLQAAQKLFLETP